MAEVVFEPPERFEEKVFAVRIGKSRCGGVCEVRQSVVKDFFKCFNCLCRGLVDLVVGEIGLRVGDFLFVDLVFDFEQRDGGLEFAVGVVETPEKRIGLSSAAVHSTAVDERKGREERVFDPGVRKG